MISSSATGEGLPLNKEGKFPEALGQLDQSINLEPGLAYLYRLRGRFRMERDDLVGTLQDFDRAVAGEGGAVSLASVAQDQTQRGLILCKMGRYREPVAAYDEA
jgi:tetratricopeptide (TPR) repeat protein